MGVTAVSLRADSKLAPEIKKWLQDYAGNDYKVYTTETGQWEFEFEDEAVATLFVLRWK